MISKEKICKSCNCSKPLSEYYANKLMADGYLSSCKMCVAVKQSKYLKENRDKLKPTKDAWRALNIEKVRASQKAYKERDRARHLAQKSEYAKRHREKYNADTAYYRAMKRNATRQYDEFEDFAINEMYALAKLRTKSLGITFHVDHIVPLVSDKVCGLHSLCNLQLLEGRLNMSKSNKYWPDMFV